MCKLHVNKQLQLFIVFKKVNGVVANINISASSAGVIIF